MKKATILFNFLFGLVMHTSYAQITFPSGRNLCESTPWKLVWYDEFDGTAINTDKWFTFLDDNNWTGGTNSVVIVPPVSKESRNMNRGTNFMDANVTVSGGSCKLTAKYQPNTWVTSYRQYTSGLIKAKQSGINVPMYFRSGKFEMRARITKAEKTWAAFWLWRASTSPTPGSEIDIFEYMPTNNADENTYSLHGWDRPGTSSETTVTGTFSYNNIYNWHTYTCEWDSNFVRIYMDNQLKFEGSRYTLTSSPGTSSGCLPVAGTAYTEDVNKAMPFIDESMSLVCSMDYRDNVEAGRSDAIFEIDYVRVYQRTPQSNLRDLCTSVSGPTSICLNVPTTYYASIGEGTFTGWSVSANMQIISSGNTSGGQPYVIVKAIANGIAKVIPNIQGAPSSCPPSEFRLEAGLSLPPAPGVTLHATSFPQKKNIKFTFSAPPPGTTYNWETLKLFSSQPPVYGTNAGTSTILLTEGEIAGYAIYATNSCGTSDYRSGAYKLENGVLIPYDAPKPAKPTGIGTLEGIGQDGIAETDNNKMEDGDIVKLFPNPAENILNIDMRRFTRQNGQSLKLKITDISGRVIYEQDDSNSQSQLKKIDVSRLAPGMYRILIAAGEKVINRKFVKQ